MQSLSCVLSLGIAASAVIFGINSSPNDNDVRSITRKKIRGVEVQVNQIQIQKLGSTAQVPSQLADFVSDRNKFTRTITISLSQKGQGTTIGPTHLELKNGSKLRPFLNGNQRFMSAVANAAIPDGFDFAEYWFQVPGETKLKDIFPLVVVHNTTNEQQEKVQFRFENIEP